MWTEEASRYGSTMFFNQSYTILKTKLDLQCICFCINDLERVSLTIGFQISTQFEHFERNNNIQRHQ